MTQQDGVSVFPDDGSAFTRISETSPGGEKRAPEGGGMVGTVIVMVVVFGILAVVAYALFELSPFAQHEDRYHEPGQRQQSPHLD